jgi:hypothetical protein
MRNLKHQIKKSSITTSEETKYDLRVLILDDIEKLKINDKDTKGKLMEIMFNEDALKKTASMSIIKELILLMKNINQLILQ